MALHHPADRRYRRRTWRAKVLHLYRHHEHQPLRDRGTWRQADWRQRRFDRRREFVETRRGPPKKISALIESAFERFEFQGMNVSTSPMGCIRTEIAKAMIESLIIRRPQAL